MDRVAVFIDAGYLFAQGSALLFGRKLQRGEILLDHSMVIPAFEAFAKMVSGAPMLRTYWYDGTSAGPTAQHIALAHLNGTKVRLGFVNSVGEQKGVDSLIVTDMINLARNRAMTDAVLLSGDEDLRVGVQQAQEFGVRVHLLGIRPSRGSQSLFLLQEADTCHEWQRSDIEQFLSCKPAITAPEVAPDADGAVQTAEVQFDVVARQTAFEVVEPELESLLASIRATGQIPRELDSKLLARGRTLIKRDLAPDEKKKIRRLFREVCEGRISSSSTSDET